MHNISYGVKITILVNLTTGGVGCDKYTPQKEHMSIFWCLFLYLKNL